MLMNYTQAQRQNKQYALWKHVCGCFECEATQYHHDVIDQVMEKMRHKGLDRILSYHDEQSRGRGLLDPLIPDGYQFCPTGKLFYAAYQEWSITN